MKTFLVNDKVVNTKNGKTAIVCKIDHSKSIVHIVYDDGLYKGCYERFYQNPTHHKHSNLKYLTKL